MPVCQSCTSVPHPSYKANAGRQSGRDSRAPLLQAQQSKGCPFSLFYASITPALLLAAQCPHLLGPGGSSLHAMLRHCLPSLVPPPPLLAQPNCAAALADWADCPHLPTLSSKAISQLVPSSLAPAGHQRTARLVLSVPSSPFPSCLVQVVSNVLHPPPPTEKTQKSGP